MRFFAIRPRKGFKRKKTKIALYTVAFDVAELRMHSSAYNGFCKNDCEHGTEGTANCNNHCNIRGEYGRLQYIWHQNGFLIRYFSNLAHLLPRYKLSTVKEAIERHKVLFAEVEDALLHKELTDYFQPLYNKHPGNKVFHPECKFKSHLRNEIYESWIRIYAVKYSTEDYTENYIITGGAIKLVGNMEDNASIQYEERKQETVIKFLIENEITTREKIETLIL